MAAAAHHLPHMSDSDLDRFISDAAGELNLTPVDVECFRMRRRRRSLELHMDADDEVATAVLDAASNNKGMRTVKVVVLGDDYPAAKADAVELFLLQGGAPTTNSKTNRPPRSAPPVFDIASRSIPVHHLPTAAAAGNQSEGQNSSGGEPVPHAVEVWMPDVSELHRFHRQEVLFGAAAIVLTYSVKNRQSLESVTKKWAAEVKQFVDNNCPPGSVDIPVLLVGLEAEARNARGASPAAVAVSAAEAVQIAQDIGAAKYMEVFADNAFHIQEVFAQAVQAALAAEAESGMPPAYLAERAALHATTFANTLSTSNPVGAFDLIRRCFTLTSQGGAIVDITLDGTDPRTSATRIRYTAPLVFERPFPSTVRAVARSRCRHPSAVVEFAVPQESPPPRGYFDVCAKVIHLFVDGRALGDAGYQIRYTADGGEPNASSPVYTGPVILDDGDSLGGVGPWRGSASHCPATIKAICVGDGMFRSRVAVFETPQVLEHPKIHYIASSGTLSIETPMPSGTVAIRYTVDGSVPTFTSTLYSRPVMLPKDGSVRKIRAAVFPLQYFPSVDVSYDVAAPQMATDPHAFATNRSAMTRIASGQAQKDAAQRLAEQPFMMAPGSRGASAKYLINSSAGNSPQRHVAIGAPPAAGTPTRSGRSSTAISAHRTGAVSPSASAAHRPKSPVAQRRTTTPPASAPSPLTPSMHTGDVARTQHAMTLNTHEASSSSRMATTSAFNNVPRSPGRAPHANGALGGGGAQAAAQQQQHGGGQAAANVSCAAQDNTVSFDFEQPIALSYMTVATPGLNRGPAMYEIYARIQGDPDGPVLVGGGHLDDFDGLQTLHVKPSARLQPIVAVKCVFMAAPGGGGAEVNTLFQINDLKIHGKPFKRK